VIVFRQDRINRRRRDRYFGPHPAIVGSVGLFLRILKQIRIEVENEQLIPERDEFTVNITPVGNSAGGFFE
jgi:hypothetical protein